ncbi:hypothetical protein [Lysinibacillus piscis]|uniref:Uncharacterized protein n=1 Tax=Lysinibacillus piscis TaxID=2518931 RepID=A0ABQ5NMG6_9BACI|nr:hypothetical protein [Lysinibacillus sp. KH24]GLC89301.1 hypothetical protein LYSBPC_24280 [Lysinibacillus sp. KH24]
MNEDLGENGKQPHFLGEALADIQVLQDTMVRFQSRYFGQLFVKMVGSDTIPFLLTLHNGTNLRLADTVRQFETEFFRIEAIEKEYDRGIVSLLRAFDYEGYATNTLADVVRLERTTTEKAIDLQAISAIQLLKPDMLKGHFIIEPKW